MEVSRPSVRNPDAGLPRRSLGDLCPVGWGSQGSGAGSLEHDGEMLSSGHNLGYPSGRILRLLAPALRSTLKKARERAGGGGPRSTSSKISSRPSCPRLGPGVFPSIQHFEFLSAECRASGFNSPCHLSYLCLRRLRKAQCRRRTLKTRVTSRQVSRPWGLLERTRHARENGRTALGGTGS